MAYLEVKTDRGFKRIELSSKAITVGRHPGNGVVVDDDRASRKHCVIEPDNGKFRLRDLGSRNGTTLNSQRVNSEILDNGDVVHIGATELRFIDPAQEAPNRRRNTPDFASASQPTEKEKMNHAAATLDIDLSTPVADALTDYERRLRDIIESAAEKPFTEQDISLMDNRGVTVHQATTSGLEDVSEEDIGEGIRVFRLLLLACFRARATDLHIEPRMEKATVRLRVDGYMLNATDLSHSIHQRLLGVVKILCQIDTSRKNVVQDGHFSVSVKGRRVDYRVSLTPSMNGQKLVVRVLDSSNAPSRLHELGLLPWMYDKIRTMATRDAGLLLACGPTGSGKTTTLYSCIREIDVVARNAITIEDPVEYYLEGATQIPIDHKQGATFATILRSVLRQDPDVIFLGEIRDTETATVAMQAAMTGHLVYSTVHSKDSIGAIFRLLDLGVEAYLVANALNLILAQRLVRTLCPTCKKSVTPTPTQNMKMGKQVSGVPKMFAPVGCKHCLATGFIGRRAIFELLEVNDQLRDVILNRPGITAIREVLSQGLFTSLAQYGYHYVGLGETSFDEVDRVAGTE